MGRLDLVETGRSGPGSVVVAVDVAVERVIDAAHAAGTDIDRLGRAECVDGVPHGGWSDEGRRNGSRGSGRDRTGPQGYEADEDDDEDHRDEQEFHGTLLCEVDWIYIHLLAEGACI